MRGSSGHVSARSPCRYGGIVALAIGLAAFCLSIVAYHPHPGYANDGVRLSGNHPIAAEAFTSLGDAAENTSLDMQIRFALRNRDELDRLLADQQNPASAHFHQWLKTGEFLHRFGPGKSEVKALEAWLTSQGFTITTRASDHLAFTGDVATAQHAFEVRIARFGDGSTYANTSDPVIPRRFAKVIGAVLGMDNMVRVIPASSQSAPFATRTQPVAGAKNYQLAAAELNTSENLGGSPIGQVIINSSEAFGPGDVRAFYDESVGSGHDGTGDCIAIVGISDFLDSAMTAFTSQFGLPVISYTRETYGGNPGINGGGESEAELDLQWAHAAAPGAAIVYHLGSDLVSDISGAVTDNQCGAISISYAFCSPSASLIENTLDPLFKQAAAQGQTVFVSSGDNGAAGQVISGSSCVAGSSKSVNEMSADPNVTSVGGTQFNPTYSGGNDVGHATEKVWNDGIGASGGGASEFFSKPGYQTGSGVPADGARDVPDIALIASPEFPGVFWGHDVGGTGQITCCIGGTSLAAPIWAGFSRVIAQLAGNTRLGNLNPLIYSLANTQYNSAGFHDVTSGNNNYNGVTGFTAGPGYDQATGWGTIDFNVFANAAENWLAASTTPTPTATPTSTMTPSATATVTATFVATPTAAPTIKSTATHTAAATMTATVAATPTVAPTATISATPTAIVSQTPTPTNVATPKPTTIPTATATQLATQTPTPTVVATSTPIITTTPTIVATSTPTVIVIPTPTATPTPISEPSGGTLSVPASVRFPAIGVGMKATQRTILIANRSTSTPLAIDVGTLLSPFTVSGAGQYTLPPRGNVPVTIVFTPDVVGTVSQTLPIRSGDPKHPFASVVVSGTVQSGVLSAPSQIALIAKSTVGATKTVILRNSGKGMLSGTVEQFAPTSSLKVLGGPIQFTLAPGKTQPITIQFLPLGGGVAIEDLAIDTAPPPGTTTILVTGTMR